MCDLNLFFGHADCNRPVRGRPSVGSIELDSSTAREILWKILKRAPSSAELYNLTRVCCYHHFMFTTHFDHINSRRCYDPYNIHSAPVLKTTRKPYVKLKKISLEFLENYICSITSLSRPLVPGLCLCRLCLQRLNSSSSTQKTPSSSHQAEDSSRTLYEDPSGARVAKYSSSSFQEPPSSSQCAEDSYRPHQEDSFFNIHSLSLRETLDAEDSSSSLLDSFSPDLAVGLATAAEDPSSSSPANSFRHQISLVSFRSETSATDELVSGRSRSSLSSRSPESSSHVQDKLSLSPFRLSLHRPTPRSCSSAETEMSSSLTNKRLSEYEPSTSTSESDQDQDRQINMVEPESKYQEMKTAIDEFYSAFVNIPTKMSDDKRCKKGLAYAEELVKRLKDLLDDDDHFEGINCSDCLDRLRTIGQELDKTTDPTKRLRLIGTAPKSISAKTIAEITNTSINLVYKSQRHKGGTFLYKTQKPWNKIPDSVIDSIHRFYTDSKVARALPSHSCARNVTHPVSGEKSKEGGYLLLHTVEDVYENLRGSIQAFASAFQNLHLYGPKTFGWRQIKMLRRAAFVRSMRT